MPTYVYACRSCGHRFEQYQSFSEDSLVTCPECAEDALRKVFDSVGIVFKGPGFYSTDSQSSRSSTASGGETGATKGAGTGAGSESSASTGGSSSGSTSSAAGSAGSSGTSGSSGSGGSDGPAAA